jgi:pyruvate, water dikinase
MHVVDTLKGFFPFWQPSKPPIPFTVLFKKFKSILERNNRILELMADMGDKLGGDYVFDRQYILDVCEKVSDLVFKLISDLSILTQSDSVELFIAFEHIQHEIQEELAGRPSLPATRQTILLEELNADNEDEVGNKFARLGDIRCILGLPTPDGFVITTKTFFDFMDHNGLRKYIREAKARNIEKKDAGFEAMCAEVRRRILQAPIPRGIASHIHGMVDTLAGKVKGISPRFAVRSSAWGEDTGLSFAGQYESVLNVTGKKILDAYRQVIASAYTPEAWEYRLLHGYREHEMAMAVICQLMVEAEVSGAMYTYAPLLPLKETMVISAAWGLGPAVVQGTAESDAYYLDRASPHEVLSSEISCKTVMMVPLADGGTEWTEVPVELQNVPSLTPNQVEKLAQAAMNIERYYKRPQDIEWAFDRAGNLFILQSRGLNVRPGLAEARPQVMDATRSVEVIFSGKGTVVQRGVGSGRVYVSRSADDLKDFPNGAILVAQYTSPKYSRIMRKANGIITDVGSPTGHMATIAREFRVPAIVDTGVATTMLKTGDEITLDAGHNAVYRGTVKELNNFELTEQEVFEESYEYRLLRRLLKKISPLNLIDTHSDNFKPGRCRTYHDITRYIHQKAVERLIDLSENYQKYHDRMPKRLKSEIPLGIMVIDVENGTDAPREARSVSVEQIKSLPLKALLEGLSESGMWGTDPAPVNLSSFMSSVTKTFSGGPMGMPNKMSRNLAVVSREYMNLNLRLGYHFNIVDAFIGDALNDNYIYFRFLGGVTDLVRRSRRVKFIAEVLDQFDFRVEVHGDLVVGRLKKNSKERMYCTMKVLGGLIGYTRQLDVSMDSEARVARYYSDFTHRILPLMEVHDGCSIGIQ